MKTSRLSTFAFTTLLLASFAGFIGCATESDGKPAAPATDKPDEAPAEKGAAQIWAENCNRCHNVRSPSQYSDAQWEVIGAHMRLRGYLTGEEQRTIVEFLKAGN